MPSPEKLVAQVLGECLSPALADLNFERPIRRQLSWTSGSLQVRAVVDSKAQDPFSGGAFTLEFEVAPDGRFERKLAGRVRLDQLLDEAQRGEFLDVRNRVASRLPSPPPEHLALLHPSFHEGYLRNFQAAEELERGHRFWLRFRTAEDLRDWCQLLVPHLPCLIDRARGLPPHELILGQPLEW